MKNLQNLIKGAGDALLGATKSVRKLVVMQQIKNALAETVLNHWLAPNSELTWNKISSEIFQEIKHLQKGKYISELQVICDKTTNKPETISAGKCLGKITFILDHDPCVLSFSIEPTKIKFT